VAKSIFLLSDIMATTDFLLKQSTTNNRHVVVLVSMYIFYLFDFFLFSVLEKRERKYGIGTKLDLDL
jgi:hypothetical protein